MTIKKNLLFLIVLLTVNTTFADSYSKEEKTTNIAVTPSIAYRYDIFKWSIPHSKFQNKKLSELTWKNYIIQPSIKIETEPKPNQFSISGQAKYGYILKNQSNSTDLDWDVYQQKSGNIRSHKFSHTVSSVKGNIVDLSGAVGYSLGLFKESLLNFYVGYDYTDYRNKNYGARIIVAIEKDGIPADQLFQKYNFTTRSPWVGLSVNIPLNDKFLIVPTIKYYSFKYVGQGYWLHRDDLNQNPSLKHNAKGTGLGFDIDFVYKYTDNLDFKVNVATKKLKMKNGQYKMFYNTKAFKGECIAIDKLFNVSLISSSISGGVRYKF